MSSIRSAICSHVDIETSRVVHDAPMVSSAGFRKALHLCAAALTAATLAGCAQSSLVTDTSQRLTAAEPAAPQQNRKISSVATRRVAAVRRKHSPFVAKKPAVDKKVASSGIASFYTEGETTANGEKFNTHELTAAHRTLPFGTRLRVTNVSTGQTVTVRVNDRGPFIAGRVVDVSYAAAESLGITDKGITKVKLDVVKDTKEAAKDSKEAPKDIKEAVAKENK
jgi:rare lipoprotein A